MTKIEWTHRPGTKGESWNVTVGCSKCSSGCARCYAERMAVRLAYMALADIDAKRDPGRKRHYLDIVDLEHKCWNGQIKIVPEALEDPMHWRKSRTVFIDSMSDLFHIGVPDDFICDVFYEMSQATDHTFIVLTKRPERMYEWFNRPEAQDSKWHQPLPNVIGMVTAENQEQADKRIPWLLRCPFAIYGVSIEPMLERIDISPYLDYNIQKGEIGNGKRTSSLPSDTIGRMEDRSEWPYLDEEERRLEEGRTQNASRLPFSQENDQSCKNPHGSPSSSLLTFQGENSSGHNDQSCKRKERRQQARELRTGNLFGEHETFIHDRTEKPGWTEESSQQTNGSASSRDQREICAGQYDSGNARSGIRCGLSDNLKNSERRTPPESIGENCGLYGASDEQTSTTKLKRTIHFVIVGGETGPRAREMNPNWARDIRDQCKASNTPFFMKQMSNRASIPDDLLIREWPKTRS